MNVNTNNRYTVSLKLQVFWLCT